VIYEYRDCGCETVTTDAGQVVSCDTCPVCLPPGAITWLIENGRQLELLEEEGVDALRGGETRDDIVRASQKNKPVIFDHGLPF